MSAPSPSRAGADILELGLVDLAARIRTGEISSLAATEAVLTALDTDGRALNAVVRLWRERALEAADLADRDRRQGRIRGPLHGVPLAHKDMFYRAGELAECGSVILRGHRPLVTSTVLERLDAAGALDIGRLNMVEFALGVTGHNPHTGHPKNAWNPARITGGSTSGGAAAVAARLVAATLGSDTGGSLRIPAAFGGLVGIKPTYGRVSRAGAMPLSFSLDHVGPLARATEDCALVLRIIAGRDPRDPTTSARPVPDYGAGLGAGIENLRVAVVEDCFEDVVAEEVASAFGEAMRSLRELGARIEPRSVPHFRPLNALRRVVMLGDAAAYHAGFVAARRGDYAPQTLARLEPGFALSATDHLRAVSARGPLLETFCLEAFAHADVLALPTSPVPAPGIAETDTGGDARFVEIANVIGGLVGPFNYLGLPAISVPMGLDANGVPMGLQLVARPFAEALLFRVAHAFERATGWSRQRPRVAHG